MLEICFPLNSFSDLGIFFGVNKLINLVPFRENASRSLLVFERSSVQGVCNANIQSSVSLAGQNIDEISAFHLSFWMDGSRPAMTPLHLISSVFGVLRDADTERPVFFRHLDKID